MTDIVTQAPTTVEPLPLPRYQSHKVVEALKIEQILYGDHGGGATLHPADTRYQPFKVSAEYVAKHAPRAGGYWVRYDDGYESFTPAKAFEEGYTLIQATFAPAGQAPETFVPPYEGAMLPDEADTITVSDPDTHA